MENSFEKNEIATNIICSSQIINPTLDYFSPDAKINKNPFLRKSIFIANYYEAIPIIMGLQEFYKKYSVEDINDINKKILQMNPANQFYTKGRK